MGYLAENAVYPKMYRVKQRLKDEKLKDIPAEVKKQLDGIGLREVLKPGMEIGVCSGSRGVNNIAVIVKAAVDYVKEWRDAVYYTCNGKPRRRDGRRAETCA